MTTSNVPSFWHQLDDIYSKWPTQLLTNLLVFVIATGFALFLDLRLGVKPESVVLYMFGLMVVLMVGIPVLLVVLQRSTLKRTISKAPHLTASKHSATTETLPRRR